MMASQIKYHSFYVHAFEPGRQLGPICFVLSVQRLFCDHAPSDWMALLLAPFPHVRREVPELLLCPEDVLLALRGGLARGLPNWSIRGNPCSPAKGVGCGDAADLRASSIKKLPKSVMTTE